MRRNKGFKAKKPFGKKKFGKGKVKRKRSYRPGRGGVRM